MSRSDVLDLTFWEMEDLLQQQNRKRQELRDAQEQARKEAEAKRQHR